MVRTGLAALFSLLVVTPSEAAPPASCASKFVGQWSISVTSTGENYPSSIRGDGTLSSSCAMCMPVQRWTCQGSTFILLDPYEITETLSADGMNMSGTCCTAHRLSAPPAEAAANQASSNTGGRSCSSDITGIGDGSKPPATCEDSKVVPPSKAPKGASAEEELRAKELALIAAYGPPLQSVGASPPEKPFSDPPPKVVIQPKPKPTLDAASKSLIAEGNSLVTAATNLMHDDRTCAGYRRAADVLFDAVYAYAKAGQMSYAENLNDNYVNKINAHVDKQEELGNCYKKSWSAPPAGTTGPRQFSPDRMAQCNAAYEQLERAAQQVANLTTAGMPAPTHKDYDLESAEVEIASAGCPPPGGEPFSKNTCERARLKWSLSGAMSPEDSIAKSRAAGCTDR